MGRWMKGTFASVEELSAYIDSTVDSIMQNEIAKGLKKAVKEKAKDNVYSYPAKYVDRRNGDGGILDESLMNITYSRPVLTLDQDSVPWQNRGHFRYIDGRGTYDKLVDAIEKKQIYGAPPRPYLEEAGDSYVSEKADSDMQKALNKAGL